MRVLFLTTSYPSAESPAAGAFVREHARAVAPHADVAIVHLDRRHDARGLYLVEREHGDEFPLWRVRYPYRPLPLSLAAHFAGAAAGYRAVRRSGFAPDLLHAHFFLAAGPAALLSLAARRPYLATEQWTAFLPEDPLRLSAPLRLAARLSLARACAVLPVSDALRRAMEASGVRARRWQPLTNAVDESLFHPATGSTAPPAKLISVGLLNEQKGFDVLLRAFAAVHASRPDAELELVGDGPLRGRLESLAAELGVGSAVTFTGLLPKEQIAGRMRRSTLFVLASRFETNGVVVLEALCSGLPVVVTHTSALVELVDDGNGLLVPPDDPDALATSVLQTLERRSEYDSAAIAERGHSRYGLAAIGDRLAEVYRSCLAT